MRFQVVATGGTFDEIHLGHLALLAKAFEAGEKVIIGVSSDEFAKRRGKTINHNYDQRVANLRTTIAERFDKVNFEIAKLDEVFGPAVTSGDVGALVASSETRVKADVLNKIRTDRGLLPVQVISVGMVKAEDGLPISSTRIRAGEVDSNGRLLGKGRRARQ